MKIYAAGNTDQKQNQILIKNKSNRLFSFYYLGEREIFEQKKRFKEWVREFKNYDKD